MMGLELHEPITKFSELVYNLYLVFVGYVLSADKFFVHSGINIIGLTLQNLHYGKVSVNLFTNFQAIMQSADQEAVKHRSAALRGQALVVMALVMGLMPAFLYLGAAFNRLALGEAGSQGTILENVVASFGTLFPYFLVQILEIVTVLKFRRVVEVTGEFASRRIMPIAEAVEDDETEGRERGQGALGRAVLEGK